MYDLLILTLIFIAVFLLLKFFPASKQQIGNIQTKSGHNYHYKVGDGLNAHNRRFNGIQVVLPVVFPHIYLDSHGDSKIRGPRFTYLNTQQLKLEGDFNTYFQLFAPEHFKTLALSIVTPDVMQTLVDTNQKYDVEIYLNYINVITHKRVKGNKALIEKLESIATKLIAEIDHKSRSWTKHNEREAAHAKLLSYDEESVKVFGRYYGIVGFTMVASFIVSLFFYILAFSFWGQESAEPFVILGTALLLFPGVQIALLYMKNGR